MQYKYSYRLLRKYRFVEKREARYGSGQHTTRYYATRPQVDSGVVEIYTTYPPFGVDKNNTKLTWELNTEEPASALPLDRDMLFSTYGQIVKKTSLYAVSHDHQ